MKKVAVLGAGMVGSIIAADLSKAFKVTSIDLDKKKLAQIKKLYNIQTINYDISSPNNLKLIVKDFDLVINALPGFMGFSTLKALIEAKKNVVDISFFEEDPFELDSLAKRNKVTAIVDCGVAPGLSNIVLGWHNKKMKIESFECYVGGLPFKRTLPFQYKAPFSPIDVIEEYTRPARIIENSKLKIKPPLSEPELIDVDPVGTLEAFNTDGLRSLIHTMKIPNMKEKTLRYPGHIKYIQFLKDAGFFSSKEININGKEIKPIDFSSKILLPHWKRKPNELEFTVLIIKISGKENRKHTEYTYKLFDRFDEKKKVTSMSRTTGFTCTAVARRVLNKDFNRIGISAPEHVGADNKCFSKIMKDLKERNIILNQTIN